MCTPQSAGGIGMGVQGAGLAMSTVGSYYSAMLQKNAYNTQADIDNINAGITEQKAQTALLSGQQQEQRAMIATANLKSTQRAGMAANGIDLSSGSAQNVMDSTDIMGKIDQNTIAANAARSAWGYRTQAASYDIDADLKRATGGAINPFINSATTLLGGAGAVANSWYRYNKVGLNGGGSLTANRGFLGAGDLNRNYA